MTTHGCGIQPGDHVMVDIEGWTIPGVVTKLSPFRVHVDMNGCKQAIEPDNLAVEMVDKAGPQ